MEKLMSLALVYRLPLLVIAVGIIFIILGSIFPITTLLQSPKTYAQTVLVDIEGEVINPGLYKLKSGLSTGEAIKIAGGLTQSADVAAINTKMNLAKPLTDGEKIFVPSKNLHQQANNQHSGTININQASSIELESLPGIGQVTAQKIIDARPYGSVEELLNRKIVSKSVFAKVRDSIAL